MQIYISCVVLNLFLFNSKVYKLYFIQELNPESDNPLLVLIIGCWLLDNRIGEYIFSYIVMSFLCLFLFVGLCRNCDLSQ